MDKNTRKYLIEYVDSSTNTILDTKNLMFQFTYNGVSYPMINEETLSKLTDEEYNARVSAFLGTLSFVNDTNKASLEELSSYYTENCE